MWRVHANPGASAGRRPTPGFRSTARWFPLLAAFTLLAGLAALSAQPPIAQAAARTPDGGRPPGGKVADPVVREVDIAEPAVVRIDTKLQFTVAVQLCTRSVTLPQSGGGYRVEGTGSGAFVSANGDILTADHVVDVPDFVLATYADQDIADVLNNASAFDPGCHYSVVVTPNMVDQALGTQISFTVHVLSHSSAVFRSTTYSGPLAVTDVQDAPAANATIVAHSPFEQNDLALLHIDATDTPSIQLDHSASVATEDRLTVIGFPGNGDLRNDRGQIKNPDNFLTPSVNEVLVSAIKTGDNGSQLIQVGGNVEQGDSGGPVLDAAGHIVGVVSFGGPYRGSTAFLRTSDNTLDMIDSNNISMTPGAFQRRWALAFADYAAATPGHWHKAAQEMATLASSYPDFKALTPYLTYAQQAANSEVAPASGGQSIDPLAGAAYTGGRRGRDAGSIWRVWHGGRTHEPGTLPARHAARLRVATWIRCATRLWTALRVRLVVGPTHGQWIWSIAHRAVPAWAAAVSWAGARWSAGSWRLRAGGGRVGRRTNRQAYARLRGAGRSGTRHADHAGCAGWVERAECAGGYRCVPQRPFAATRRQHVPALRGSAPVRGIGIIRTARAASSLLTRRRQGGRSRPGI
ncbi:MAG: hypothetical protein PVSMB4_01530 [Ktedonobacterales bacterium]